METDLPTMIDAMFERTDKEVFEILHRLAELACNSLPAPSLSPGADSER